MRRRKDLAFEEVKATAPVGRWLEEAVRARAYELFLERREEEGDAQGDWLRAEREVYERFGVRAEGTGS